MITTLGALVDKAPEAEKLCEALQQRISKARAVAETLPRRPRIYFEEWYDPMISGIGVTECAVRQRIVLAEVAWVHIRLTKGTKRGNKGGALDFQYANFLKPAPTNTFNAQYAGNPPPPMLSG